MRLKFVCVLAALCVGITSGDRGESQGLASGSKKSIHLTRDGHFHLAADIAADAPLQEDVTNEAPRQIRALHPVEPHTVDERITEPRVVADRKKGGWYNSKQQKPLASPSSFANRTDNWMTLSQIASGSLSSTHVQIATPRPTVPPERYKKKPKSWPMRAWNEYERAYEKLKPLREGPGHHVATVAAVFLGPESCILKILYVFFTKEGEDDYPYVPRGCGDMFDFAMNANSIPVPWMLIASALFVVTGIHSSMNTDH